MIAERRAQEVQEEKQHQENIVKVRVKALETAQEKIRKVIEEAQKTEINTRTQITEENIKAQEKEAVKLIENKRKLLETELEENAAQAIKLLQQQGATAEEILKINEELENAKLLLKENAMREISKIEIEADKKYADLKAQSIADNVKREQQLAENAIREEYQKRMELYKDNAEIMKRLNVEMNQAIAKSNKEIFEKDAKEKLKIYMDEWQKKFDIAKKFTAMIEDIGKKNKEFESREKQLNASLKAQENALQASYLRRELTDEQYHLKRVELEMQAEEELAKMREEKMVAYNEALQSGFSGFKDMLQERSQALLEALATDLLTADEHAEKMKELNQLMYAGIAASAAETFADILTGQEEFGKSMVLFALKTLEQMIPIFVAKQFGTSTGQLGLAGIAVAAGLAATLKALTAIARAAMFEGGLIKNGVRHKDSVPAILAKGEFVTNNTTVSKGKNLEILELANKTKGNIIDIVMEKYGIKGIGAPNIEMLQKFSNTNPAIVVNTSGQLEKQIKQTNRKLDTLIGAFYDNNYITENTNKILKKDTKIKYNINNTQRTEAIFY
jgi:hypothetical protein